MKKNLASVIIALVIIISNIVNTYAIVMRYGPFIIHGEAIGYAPFLPQDVGIYEISNWNTQQNLIYFEDSLSFNFTWDTSPYENWKIIYDYDSGTHEGYIEIVPAISGSKIGSNLRLTALGDTAAVTEYTGGQNQRWHIETVFPDGIDEQFQLKWDLRGNGGGKAHFIIKSAANGHALSYKALPGHAFSVSLKPYIDDAITSDILWDFFETDMNMLWEVSDSDGSIIHIDGSSTKKNKTIKIIVGKAMFTLRGVTGSFADDSIPYIEPDTGKAMIPIRAIAELLGARLEWVEAIKADYVTLMGKTASVALNKPLSGNMGMAVIQNDRLFVPVRYISEQLGAKVDWDGKAQVIAISFDGMQ